MYTLTDVQQPQWRHSDGRRGSDETPTMGNGIPLDAVKVVS